MPAKQKGHWPAGKPRNPPAPRGIVTTLRRSIRRRGLRQTASRIGCDPRSIYRWLAGRSPTPEIVTAILALENAP